MTTTRDRPAVRTPRSHGNEVTLSADGYTATIAEVGAALRSLRHGGRDLVLDVDAAVPTPPFSGAVLAPWPNRIANGRYRFGGQAHQLPVDEVGRGNALHGLALWERWTLTSESPAAATFEHTLWPRPGYPFTIILRASYELGPDGLRISVEAINAGVQDAPVGLSTHPHLTVGTDVLDEWSMRLPCREVVVTDDRLLPSRVVAAGHLGLDFRADRAIGDAMIDNAFTGIDFDEAGAAEAVLTDSSGAGVRVRWDEACRWLQVYTLHAPGRPMHRRAVALEPMTCAPDAFNSGAGLIVLTPGDSTSMAFTIGAVEGVTA